MKFEPKHFVDKDGNPASPEAAATIANEKVKDLLREVQELKDKVAKGELNYD